MCNEAVTTASRAYSTAVGLNEGVIAGSASGSSDEFDVGILAFGSDLCTAPSRASTVIAGEAASSEESLFFGWKACRY